MPVLCNELEDGKQGINLEWPKFSGVGRVSEATLSRKDSGPDGSPCMNFFHTPLSFSRAHVPINLF